MMKSCFNFISVLSVDFSSLTPQDPIPICTDLFPQNWISVCLEKGVSLGAGGLGAGPSPAQHTGIYVLTP